jgi:hypothetical protein
VPLNKSINNTPVDNNTPSIKAFKQSKSSKSVAKTEKYIVKKGLKILHQKLLPATIKEDDNDIKIKTPISSSI